MIVGTAGHIDHGKTSLVKALTGVDTDRLKEEKERGITVDLGFAYLPQADGETIGFVDVPGHERLVRNMLAGATGIDVVLLVIAADDGPMPQTLEHLAIVDLLALTRGVVALSKSDLATPERIAQLSDDIRRLLAPTGLAGAPIVPVSSRTGAGLQELLAQLRQTPGRVAPAVTEGGFRLSVDRSFALPGVGTVVTGTAIAGRVAVDDRLLVSPGGQAVRVRGLHAQNRRADVGERGQRLALNLAGIEKDEVQRGDWIVAPALHVPTRRIDARLHLLGAEAKAMDHWTPVHLHLGACDVPARIALLEAPQLKPGASAYVQIETERPISALAGDRIIVRDQSATRTLGGGQVVDIYAPGSRRHKAQRLALLQALDRPSATEALAAALALEEKHGIDLAQFAVLRNLAPPQMQQVLAQVAHQLVEHDHRQLAFADGQLDRYATRINEHLARFHQKTPDSPGVSFDQLVRAIRERPATAIFQAWLDGRIKAGQLKRAGPHISLPGHSVSLQGAEKAIWERIKPMLDEGGIHPPRLDDILMRDRSLRRDQVLRTLQRLERMGKVRAVGNDYFIQLPHLLQLAQAAEALAKADTNRRLNVKDLREKTGMSRHLSLPLVEFFDRIGLTERDTVGRHFKRNPRKLFEG